MCLIIFLGSLHRAAHLFPGAAGILLGRSKEGDGVAWGPSILLLGRIWDHEEIGDMVVASLGSQAPGPGRRSLLMLSAIARRIPVTSRHASSVAGPTASSYAMPYPCPALRGRCPVLRRKNEGAVGSQEMRVKLAVAHLGIALTDGRDLLVEVAPD